MTGVGGDRRLEQTDPNADSIVIERGPEGVTLLHRCQCGEMAMLQETRTCANCGAASKIEVVPEAMVRTR